MTRYARAYLDHASTSPLRPSALQAMLPYLTEHHGDPGRIHHEGRVTRVALETAREQVAELFGARPREVIFTSSGTEAVNAAIFGAVAAMSERSGSAPHVVTTAVEHSAVLDACRRHDVELSVAGVDSLGRFDAAEVASLIRDDTALVSVQLANHEVGTIQPAAEVVARSAERGAPVHLDACAAAGHLPVRFVDLGPVMMSVSAHKLGGPKGAGALMVRKGRRFPSLLVGGAQERARRAGLENVPAAVGFGAACAELVTDDCLSTEAAEQSRLTQRLASVIDLVAGSERFGDPEDRLPHLVCLGVSGVEAEPILLALDQRGVAAHSGSSCSSETLEPSPVLEAMGVDAAHSLRLSVGWSSTEADVDRCCDALPEIVEKLRDLRGLRAQ